MSGEWQLSSNGLLTWGEEPDEDRNFMAGMLVGEFSRLLTLAGSDEKELGRLSERFVYVFAKEKIKKLAEHRFLVVTFTDMENDILCHPHFRPMDKNERAAAIANKAIEEAKKKGQNSEKG